MKRLKPLVLAVDDDPDFRKGLEVVLSRLGLNVKGVSTTDAFLTALKQLTPDLALVDLQLGEESGLELIRNVRADAKNTLPILVISGTRESSAIERALDLGANDYIVKPLDRKFLASKLSQFITTPELGEHKSDFPKLPYGNAPAKLLMKCELLEIDELGVRLKCPSLIPKGTALKVDAEHFAKIGLPQREILVSVTSTELDPTDANYRIYAEFDGADAEFLQRIRRWLTT